MTIQGKVFLVGAGLGPGDPDLLTIKAAKAIACADMILVDDLVNPAILDHAPAQARIGSPSIIVIGDVVRCAAQADFNILSEQCIAHSA